MSGFRHARFFAGLTVSSVFAALVLSVALMAGAPSGDASAAGAPLPLMRFPDIYENTVVFVCGEDIWSAPASGGVATRLTLNDGQERYPRFSPDGKLIAFSGEYDGNTDVYVMNVYGGDIRRVTWHPGEDTVVGWHPVSGKIIFSSGRNAFNRFSRLYMVSPDGTGLEELIMHEAAWGSFSPDGRRIAYNRVAREHRTWKRYRGGLAQDIYMFDFDTMKDTRLTDFEGTDRLPMWIGDRIYFTSDRDRVLNIYSLDPATGEVSQMTRHTEYDVRRPSEGSGRIVYEHGGDIWSFDVASGNAAKLDIKVMSDAPETRPYLKDVHTDITDIDCSPEGNRAVVIARGELFTVPVENGVTRNLSSSCGSREKDPVWSPDGSKIAYLSDKSGEYEIYVVPQDGSGKAVQVTDLGKGYRHTLRWSPDGTRIAFTDETLTCRYLELASGKVSVVDKAYYENVDISLDVKPIYDFAWSPDSRYLAYSKMTEEGVYNVFVHDIGTGKNHNVSMGIFNDFHPTFSKDGKHLFFVSNRRFTPVLCDFEWEMVYKDAAGIYALTLQKGGGSILPFRSDEAEMTGDGPGGKSGKDTENKGSKIDFDGIAERIENLPLPPGNFRYPVAGDGCIFYLNKDEGDFNRFEFRGYGSMDLFRFSFEDREEKKVIGGIDEYKLSSNGKKLVYRQGATVGIIDATATDSEGSGIDLSDLVFKL
ncbi:MAG TPA: hypothetical protein VLA34_01645, partial [Candidatus Krumholzibacterium sp.]|nr:hypothetical protein [Candidatus Krumholzibacterium sp.]